MKKTKDVGLQYLRKIHFLPPPLNSNPLKDLARRFGRREVAEFLQSLEDSGRNYYELKNSWPNQNLVRAFTAHMDSAYIRAQVNWIHKHKDAFGKDILEIGCDTGATTGFLALELPDAHITVIERSPASVQMTQALLDQLHVTNVTLICAELADYLQENPERKFDTIFSSRTLEDNLDEEISYPDYQPLQFQLDYYYLPAALPYTRLLSRAVQPGGTLICVSEADRSSSFCATLVDLGILGWTIDYDACSFLPLRGKPFSLPAFIARAEGPLHTDLQKIPDQLEEGSPASQCVNEAANFWIHRILTFPIPAWTDSLESDLAAWYLADQLILGLGLYEQGTDTPCGRITLYSIQDSPDAFLLQRDLEDVTDLRIFPIAQLEEQKEYLQKIYDGRVTDFSPESQEILSEKTITYRWLQRDPETCQETPVEE